MASLLDKIWASLGSTGTTPTDEKIELGFVQNDKPTWQRLNWLFNRIDENLDSLADESNTSMLKNMQIMTDTTPAATCIGCIYSFVRGEFWKWDGVLAYYLDSSETWTSGTNDARIAAGSNIEQISQNSTHLIFRPYSGETICGLADGTFVPTKESITGITAIHAIETKFAKGGTDDFILVTGIGASAEMRYSTTGIGGSWIASTTPPPAHGIARWIGGDSFIHATWNSSSSSSDFYLSTDNADTFALVHTGASSESCTSVDSDQDGTLCGIFIDSGSPSSVRKSVDNGTTWTEVLTGSNLEYIKHLRDRTWLITGDITIDNVLSSAAITNNNGSTWELVDLAHSSASTTRGLSIAFNGYKAVYQENDNGVTVKSLSL